MGQIEEDSWTCPACGTRYRWRPEFAGQVARCKSCASKLQLPEFCSGAVELIGDELYDLDDQPAATQDDAPRPQWSAKVDEEHPARSESAGVDAFDADADGFDELGGEFESLPRRSPAARRKKKSAGRSSSRLPIPPTVYLSVIERPGFGKQESNLGRIAYLQKDPATAKSSSMALLSAVLMVVVMSTVTFGITGALGVAADMALPNSKRATRAITWIAISCGLTASYLFRVAMSEFAPKLLGRSKHKGKSQTPRADNIELALNYYTLGGLAFAFGLCTYGIVPFLLFVWIRSFPRRIDRFGITKRNGETLSWDDLAQVNVSFSSRFVETFGILNVEFEFVFRNGRVRVTGLFHARYRECVDFLLHALQPLEEAKRRPYLQ